MLNRIHNKSNNFIERIYNFSKTRILRLNGKIQRFSRERTKINLIFINIIYLIHRCVYFIFSKLFENICDHKKFESIATTSKFQYVV